MDTHTHKHTQSTHTDTYKHTHTHTHTQTYANIHSQTLTDLYGDITSEAYHHKITSVRDRASDKPLMPAWRIKKPAVPNDGFATLIKSRKRASETRPKLSQHVWRVILSLVHNKHYLCLPWDKCLC